MPGCAMSEDAAEHISSAGFSRRPHPHCGLSFGPPVHSQHRRPAMTIASHPFDALMNITARPDIVFARGEGSWLWDDTGKSYLDFIQGWAVNALGHCPPVLIAALTEQAKRLITPSP